MHEEPPIIKDSFSLKYWIACGVTLAGLLMVLLCLLCPSSFPVRYSGWGNFVYYSFWAFSVASAWYMFSDSSADKLCGIFSRVVIILGAIAWPLIRLMAPWVSYVYHYPLDLDWLLVILSYPISIFAAYLVLSRLPAFRIKRALFIVLCFALPVLHLFLPSMISWAYLVQQSGPQERLMIYDDYRVGDYRTGRKMLPLEGSGKFPLVKNVLYVGNDHGKRLVYRKQGLSYQELDFQLDANRGVGLRCFSVLKDKSVIVMQYYYFQKEPNVYLTDFYSYVSLDGKTVCLPQDKSSIIQKFGLPKSWDIVSDPNFQPIDLGR